MINIEKLTALSFQHFIEDLDTQISMSELQELSAIENPLFLLSNVISHKENFETIKLRVTKDIPQSQFKTLCKIIKNYLSNKLNRTYFSVFNGFEDIYVLGKDKRIKICANEIKIILPLEEKKRYIKTNYWLLEQKKLTATPYNPFLFIEKSEYALSYQSGLEDNYSLFFEVLAEVIDTFKLVECFVNGKITSLNPEKQLNNLLNNKSTATYILSELNNQESLISHSKEDLEEIIQRIEEWIDNHLEVESP